MSFRHCSIVVLVLMSCFFSTLSFAATEVLQGYSSSLIDQNPDKPAWINVCDIDGDGKKEIIISVFAGSSPMGAGYLSIYKMVNGKWNKAVVAGSEGIKFPNDPTFADVDEDGDLDIILPAGFLATAPSNSGALYWFENLGAALKWKRHDIVTRQKLFYHYVVYNDMNSDGKMDLLTVGEFKSAFGGSDAEVHLFKGLGGGKFQTTPEVIMGKSMGSLPSLCDIDKDGDLDIVSAQYFVSDASAVWLENSGSGKWTKHVIEERVGPSIQFSVIDNLCGDGARYAVLSNHVNTSDDPTGPKEGVFLYPLPTDSEELKMPWSGKLISNGIKSRKSPAMGPQGAPGVYRWGDPDADGDIDLVVHGDGDARAFLIEQTYPGIFETRVLATEVPQGGVAVDDVDGDGFEEIIVSSYEANKLLLIRKNRMN
ncbi:MAG: VCBS repeat-containing protein [Candidatus Riflebacteria bacterium]|nr:VCBS repeat-containing protein [Candidatus Riflebacteria bacterium]